MQSIVSTSLRSNRLHSFGVACLVVLGSLCTPIAAASADQLFQTAQKQYQGGDINKAISSLQQVLASNKDYVDALALLGSCYVEMGQFDKAIEPYHHAFQIKPGDRAILKGYQTALDGAGILDAQVPVLHTLFLQNPTDDATSGKYLSVLESLGPTRFPREYSELLDRLRQTPNADPTYASKLTKFYFSIGKFVQAVPVLKDMLQEDPESVENWKQLAQALDAAKNPGGAKEAYQKAILYSSNADERAGFEQAIKDIGTGRNVPAPVAIVEEKPAEVAPAPVVQQAAPVVDHTAELKAAQEADRQAKLDADRQAKDEAARVAAEAAQRKADQQAALNADRQAKLDADRQAKDEAARVAAEAAQRKADQQAALNADRQAKLDADRQAKEDAARVAAEIAQQKTEQQAALDADRKARLESERQAKADQLAALEADRKAKLEADQQAKEEAARVAREIAQQKAEQQAALDADRKAQLEAERQAKEEAAKYAREEAERGAKERADNLAQAEAMRKAKDEEERQFLTQVDAVLTQKPGQFDTLALLTKIQDRRASSKIQDPRLVEAEGILDYYQMSYSMATEQFRKLKVMSPLDTRLMALSYYEQQDFPNAIKLFTKIVGIRESKADWEKYLNALVQSGQRAPAALEYESYLLKYPTSEDALNFLVDFYRAPLQKEKLIPKLELKLAKEPKDAGLLSELIGLVDKSSPKAIEYRQRLLEVNPDDNNTKLELAKMQDARGNRPEAIKYYVAVASDYSSDKAYNLKLADLLLQEHKTSDAVKYLELAQNADPMDKALILRLAGMYEEAKQADKTREAYLKAFDVDTKDKLVQAKILEAYKSQGKEERRDVLMRIDASDPTAHVVQFQLAKLSLEDGDKDRAFEYLSKALKLQPQNTEYQSLLPSVVSNDYQVAEYLPLLETMAQQPTAKPELQMMVAKGLLAKQNSLGAAKYFALVYAKEPKLLEGNRDAIMSLYGTKQYPALAVLTTQYSVSNPDDREIRMIQVEALTATGKGGEEMRRALAGLIQADPSGGSKQLLKLAALDLQAKDTAAAVQHTETYLESNPKSAEGWHFLYPLITGKAGQEDLRIKTLEQLLALDPTSELRYDRELSELYIQRENYDAAQKSLSRAVVSAPADAALSYRLGEVEVKQSKEASAAQRFAKAYQLQTENAVYARTYGQTLTSQEQLKATLPLWRFLSQKKPVAEETRKYAQSLFLNGEFAASAKEWDGLVKDDENLAKTEPMVAESYTKSGQLAKARKILEARAETESGNPQLLESIAMLYKQENNNDGYMKALGNLVQLNPKYKSYLLVLAQEKEKAKDFKGSLDLYEQWVNQNPGDVPAIKSMHHLAGQLNDTTRLTDALVRLTKVKGEDIAYRYQLLEIDYLRGGSLLPIEQLSKLHPEWKHGKEIIVRHYLKQGQKAKLIGYIPFLEAESQTDKNLLEPLGDIYAFTKNNLKANASYWGWLQANPKKREAFDKVYAFGKSTSSSYMGEILKLGAMSFPEDGNLQRQYALSLGNSEQALTVYQAILSKEQDTSTLEKAINVAMTLKQFALASKWIAKWGELAPNNNRVWETMLSVAEQTANKNQEIEALNKLTALNPGRKDVLQHLGQAYETQAKADKAADAYTRLLALDPKNRDVFHKLKTLLVKNPDQYKAVLLTVDSADATAHEAQFDLAKIYLAAGDKEKAYAYDTKALKLQPQNADYQALLPLTITKDDQVQQYLPVLNGLAQLPGAKSELEYMVARGYLAKKDNVQAVKFLMSVNSKSPKTLETDKDAILALNGAKQYPAVAALSAKFLAANPADKEVRAAQVEAYMAVGKTGSELREALKALSENFPEAAAKHLLKLAELDLQAKDTTAALTHSKAYAGNNAKSLEAWKFVYPLVKGKKAEQESYRKSLEALAVLDTAQHTRYDRELVEVYVQEEKYDDAQKVLQKELKSNPRDAAFWFRMGEVDGKQHRDSSAALRYGKAYEIEPANLVYARSFGKTVSSESGIKSNLTLWKFLSQRQSTDDEKHKLAQSLFMNGDYLGASHEWDGLLQTDSSLKSSPMVSQSYLRASLYPKARAHMEARLKNEPTNMDLLEDLLTLNKLQTNPAGYLDALERIVQIEPKRKNYQLLLAQEREKAKDKKGALDAYDQYIARTGGDLQSLQAMQKLADDAKDTVRLVEALVRLNRDKNADLHYKFQMAAVDYARGGSIVPIEKLTKLYPTFAEGKVVLVKEYLKKREAAKLAPYLPIMDQLVSQDRTLSEAAGDVYAQLKQVDKANEAYYTAYSANKKDKALFDKVYDYAKKTNSTYRPSLLRQGYDTFTDDVALKFDFAESLGKTPRALEVYNKILANDPNQLVAIRNASEVSLALGKTDSTVVLLRRWTQLETQNIRPWTLLADLYQRGRKDTALAAEALGKVSELSPKDGKAAYAASQAYRKIGDKNRALEYLNQAVTLQPQEANYQKEQALLMVELGQADKAKASLLLVDKKFPRDEAVNKALYDVYVAAGDKNAARERMRILYSIKQYSKFYAISLAKLENELNNPVEVANILSRPELRDTMDAKLSLALLDAYFKTNQKDRAAVLGPQLLQKYPDEAKKSLPLGVLFYNLKNRPKAKEILEAYTKDNDTSTEAFYYLGKIRYEEKNWADAADALEKSKNFQPDVPALLGESYAQSGGGAKAAQAYEDYYAKSKDPKTLDQLYKLYKQLHDTSGNMQRTLERLLVINPNNMDYRAELASIYLSHGDSKQAEEQFQQILKVNPAHPLANYKLGVMLAQRQDWVHAEPMLQAGSMRYPDSLNGWLLLGDANLALKRPQPALMAFKRAAKLAPQNVHAAVGRLQVDRELNMTADMSSAAAAVLQLDSDNVEAGSTLAGIRFQEHKYAEAAPLYARVVSKVTDDKQIWINYGQSLLELKRTTDAKNALQSAINLGASDPRVMTSLARLYQQEGNTEQAEALLKDMLKKDPNNPWAYFGLGQIAADRKQDGVAEQNFRKACQLAPTNGEYAEALARLLYSKDEYAKAIAVLEAARAGLNTRGRLLYGQSLAKEGKSELALSQIKAVYEKEPTPEVMASLADLYVARGRVKDAIALLDTSSAKSDANVQFSLAKARIVNGEPNLASPFLEQLISKDAQNPDYYYQRGLVNYMERIWSDAQSDFASALKYDAGYTDASYYLGMSLLKLGKLEEAQNSFKELAQNKTPSIQSKGFYGMAMAFDADRKLEAVENYLNKSIAAKESPDALSSLGRLYLRQRKPQQAEKPARRALELSPGDPSATGVLSETEMALGRKDAAIDRITKALVDHPNSCELQLGAAKIQFLAGNYDKSSESGLTAVSNCPDDPGGYFFLAMASDRKSNKKEAKRFFGEFVKHGGDASNVPADYR